MALYTLKWKSKRIRTASVGVDRYMVLHQHPPCRADSKRLNFGPAAGIGQVLSLVAREIPSHSTVVAAESLFSLQIRWFV
jgi:hypothetical protein